MSAFAFVFPGQGSQSVDMLGSWRAASAAVRTTLEEANDAVGFDLAALAANGPEAELNRTAVTQPAMLMADVAIWRAWCEAGGEPPAVMAGHSLGEYAALVAAGVINFADAMRLVHQRGSWMQAAVAEGAGAMAAIIGLDDAAVETLCLEHAGDEVLQAVNFNAPGQVVVAGHRSAVERLLSHAKSAGARMARQLPVSVPAHSRLMEPVADQLDRALRALTVNAPRIPVLHNVDAQACADPDALIERLARQVCVPVQWVDTMRKMETEYGIAYGCECGPGQVLCGLAKRTIKQVPFHALSGPDKLDVLLEEEA